MDERHALAALSPRKRIHLTLRAISNFRGWYPTSGLRTTPAVDLVEKLHLWAAQYQAKLFAFSSPPPAKASLRLGCVFKARWSSLTPLRQSLRIPLKDHSLQFTIDRASGSVIWLRVLSWTNLRHFSRHCTPNRRCFILLRTLCRSCKSQLLWNQADPHSFAKIPGVGYPSRKPPSRISNLQTLAPQPCL